MVIIDPRQLSFNLCFVPRERRAPVSYAARWLRSRFPLSHRHAAVIAELHFGNEVQP